MNSITSLFWRELRFRSGSFLLGVLGVIAVAACLTGSHAFLKAHDYRTEKLTRELEERSSDRMDEMRDEARKFSKNLGFNCMLLPTGQNLGELYASGRSSVFLDEKEVATLAEAKLETINHLRPILRERIHWPEKQQDIILVGVRGEVYIKAPHWQKPIEEAIAAGKVHVGRALAEAHGLEPGSELVFKGRTLTVEHVLPQAGNEDDISLRVDLLSAQEILGYEGKVSAVLALSCTCADGDPDLIRREVVRFVPDLQVVDFAVRARARVQARTAIAEGTTAELDDIKESRQALRRQVAGFSRILTGLVTLGTVLLLSVLTLNNARERRTEVAMMRALGVRARSILVLFIMKALLSGLLGGILGCLLGVIGAQAVVGEGAGISFGYAGGVIAATIAIALITTLIPAARAAAEDPAGILNRE